MAAPQQPDGDDTQWVRACCVQSELRRRLSDELASRLLNTLILISRMKTLPKVHELANSAIAMHGLFSNADERIAKRSDE